MRLLRLMLALALIVPIALCVQENANNVTNLSLFGQPIFSNVSTPIVIVISVLFGMLLAVPLLAFSRRTRRKRLEKKEEHDRQKKTDKTKEDTVSLSGRM